MVLCFCDAFVAGIKGGEEGRVKSQWRFPSNPALYTTECGVVRRGEIISFILLVLVIYVGLWFMEMQVTRGIMLVDYETYSVV